LHSLDALFHNHLLSVLKETVTKDMEPLIGKMVMYMQGVGMKDYLMDTEIFFTKMETVIRANSVKVKRMETEDITGKTATIMMEAGRLTNQMEEENTIGHLKVQLLRVYLKMVK